MTVSFETKTSVFTDDGQLVGDIEEQDRGWTFTAAAEIPLSADELIQIGEHMKALNVKPHTRLLNGAKYIIEAMRMGASVADYAREINEWLNELNWMNELNGVGDEQG